MRLYIIRYGVPGGEWRHYEMGANICGLRFEAVVFESPQELRALMEHPQYLHHLTLGFPPKKQEQHAPPYKDLPILIVDRKMPPDHWKLE